MARLPIIVAPDPFLKQIAAPVEAVDDALRTLMDDMLETMYAAPGIGLAAPQVGVSKRVLVVDPSRTKDPNQPLKMVNPEIIEASEDARINEEGCLSLPANYAEVERPDRVTVRYLDETGAQKEIRAEGLLSTCVQHEIDHLDGILFVDHISSLKRNIILRRLRKTKRQDTDA
ncbi:MAG: peptide deformylase [Rhodospirillales bacterium]